MAPLAAALALLLSPAAAGQFGEGPGVNFNRNCQSYAPDKITDRSAATVEKIVSAYLAGSDGYTVQFVDDPSASPEIAELYRGSDRLVVRWSPAVWNTAYTNNDLNRVKCMLAHEAAHVRLGHPKSDREILDEKTSQLLTPDKRAEIDKKMVEFQCKPLGNGHFSGFKCDELYQVFLQEPIRNDPGFVAFRRRHEIDADQASLHIVAETKIDGKTVDPWACWSMMFSMPEAPPPKKNEPPDIHPANAARAQAMAAELKKMGGKEPCL